MLPTQVNEGLVLSVGPGRRGKDGEIIPVSVKAGDKVLLPECERKGQTGSQVANISEAASCRTQGPHMRNDTYDTYAPIKTSAPVFVVRWRQHAQAGRGRQQGVSFGGGTLARYRPLCLCLSG